MLMSKIKERINYLKMELAHEKYHDGWVIKDMKDELKELENKLKNKEDI